MEPLSDLQTQVAANVSVEQSATILINGFASRLQAGIDAARAGDFTTLTTLKTDLTTSATSLAAAVAQNTPAA